MKTEEAPRIDYLPNGTAVLRAETALFVIDEDSAEAQGLSPLENTRWVPITLVLDHLCVYQWQEWAHDPGAVGVYWRDGSCVLRMTPAAFGALYESWLGKRSVLSRLEN
jgi:hypothetical protein